jgi:PD-(D/E)XK nuclease superfamily
MDGGGLEIVDFKTGKREGYENPAPDEIDQLGVYAEALRAIGLADADTPVKLTYAFLDGEPPITRMWVGEES